MSGEVPIWNISRIAGADLRTKQHYAVKLNSDGDIILAGAGENAVGILQDKPNSGEVGSAMTLGESMAVYGASVTAGNNLTPDANGKLVPATGSDAIVAMAAESGSANEKHSVYIVSRASTGAIQKSVIPIPVKLNKIANGDILTEWTPGFPGRIVSWAFAVIDPATTAAKAATLNLEINTTNVTGGLLALTSANCTPLGNVVAGAAITGANTFGATDKISIEASSVTAFIEGEGLLLITVG